MQPTVYQKPEIRDANDNIIQQGAFGKNTALANATNDGWIDYVANDLEFLYGLAKDEIVPVPSLPASGQTNKTYLLTTTGVSYRWSGTQWVAVSSSEAVGRAESAALLAEQWATKTDGTVDGTEYSAKYYAEQAQQSADDAQDVADDMATHLVQIDRNRKGVSENDNRISNIEKLLQGNLYDYQTDSDEAYTKTVPVGALPYAGLEKLGGKTIAWNQLAPNGYSVSADSNVAFDRGTLIVKGNKYLVRRTLSDEVSVSNFIQCNVDGNVVTSFVIDGTKTQAIVTAQQTGKSDGTNVTSNTGNCYIYQSNYQNEVTVTNLQIFDLTLMFGDGHEPTIDEFNAMFPANSYPYNSGELVNAGVTEIVSKDSNGNTLQTYEIPSTIQELLGYGRGAFNGNGDYIDFERKVYVHRALKTTLDGTENWRKNSGYFGVRIGAEGVVESGGISNRYAHNIVTASTNYYGFYVYSSTAYDASRVAVRPPELPSNATVDDFKALLAEKPMVVEYTVTPQNSNYQEIDISDLLAEDSLINVEANGTLTFKNGNDSDYHIPVPSTETYMIDLQEAVSNG